MLQVLAARKYLQRLAHNMKHDLHLLIGWQLDHARVWLKKNQVACAVNVVEIAPPAKPPRRETAKSKRAPQADEKPKPRERSGDWRVLRCRYVNEGDEMSGGASTCGAIEIVTACEILRND